MTTSPYYDSGPLAGSGIDVTVEAQSQACGVPDDDYACTWQGTVDVRWDGARGTWTCPDCSSEWEAWR